MTKTVRMIAPLAAAALLVGCTTTNPNTGETQRSQTGTGATIGAVVGAAAGALSGDGSTSRRDRALIGAAVGAAAGGGIGAYMDKQEEQLRQSMEGTGIGVERQGNDIILNMPSSVTFGFDSSELTMQARNALNDVSSVLTQYPETRVNIAGHTDSTGDASYNQRLSERRAQAVGSYLSQSGVASNRLYMNGYGENQPVASNETEAGRAQNRRVEITLTPMSQG
ncbi:MULTISPECIES: OmpA family protein [Halomonas]|uniref:Cell envelope biogenesis protein OmpA n=2 Tax=Halomonas TaxID=2745 RepID=A0ABQ0U4X0_9GAMM|nr:MULTISPECIES: OmpA family protein [Halomonas]PSJ22669.1 cell envelope biogenesis protein OmpA [Halomonas sp. ND22Bw]KGE78652.1 cell envelope biogenesis protein OmpA [Halomonas salina]MDR5889130.1 OmpA family protein [Halomonas salina]WJY07313.1 OmpA family protein [Halomonas halophila]GEK73475.1 cell envelope biogenesis protein OmpA [Halomonas halophila]